MHYALNIHDYDYGSPLNPLRVHDWQAVLSTLRLWGEEHRSIIADMANYSPTEAAEDWQAAVLVMIRHYRSGVPLSREYRVIDGFRIAIAVHDDGADCECEDF